ncbi:MAG: hypothetical protein WBN51_12305 [Gammaproteobacteria bacterium]
MPLARYFAGEFEPAPLPAGEKPHEAQHKGTSPRQAEERMKAIQDSLTQTLGMEVRWTDEGDVAFIGTTERRMLHALRSLAAWHEYPQQAEFVLLEEPRDHSSLKRIYRGDQTGYPHLMRHSDNRGFWFPVDYPEPAQCNEAGWWLIGSSLGLRRELDRIALLIEALPPGADREFLENAHTFFVRAVAAANEHELPVIIEGS